MDETAKLNLAGESTLKTHADAMAVFFVTGEFFRKCVHMFKNYDIYWNECKRFGGR
jgi:hypothetical protein